MLNKAAYNQMVHNLNLMIGKSYNFHWWVGFTIYVGFTISRKLFSCNICHYWESQALYQINADD